MGQHGAPGRGKSTHHLRAHACCDHPRTVAAQFLRSVVRSGNDEEAGYALDTLLRLAAATGSITQHLRIALFFAAHAPRVLPRHLRAFESLCAAAQPTSTGDYVDALAARLDAGGAPSAIAACASVLAVLDARARAAGAGELRGARNAANSPHLADGDDISLVP